MCVRVVGITEQKKSRAQMEDGRKRVGVFQVSSFYTSLMVLMLDWEFRSEAEKRRCVSLPFFTSGSINPSSSQVLVRPHRAASSRGVFVNPVNAGG